MSGTSRAVHAVLPAGIDDPTRPSGGNVYDRRVLDGLRRLGWPVVEHEVGGDWPRPVLSDLARLSLLLDRLPDGSLLLVDGLVASGAASVLPAASTRLAVVVLLHMPLGPGPAEETVLSSAAAVLTTSEWARAQVRSWYGVRRVYAVRPGTDRSPLATGSGTGSALLCVAGVHPGKGHDLLLDALSRLGDRPWTLLCAGSLDLDPAFATDLQNQVYARRWERRVTFAGPLVGRTLRAAYEQADLVVLPSRSESFGMVVTEALAHGLPVVATRVGGVPEALGRAPGGTLPGLLVAPDDPSALADGLARWLDERYLRERLPACGGVASADAARLGPDRERGLRRPAAGLRRGRRRDREWSPVSSRTFPPTLPSGVRRSWPWLRLLGGATVLAALLWHFGSGPFAEAWRVTSWPAVVGAVVVTLACTLTSAWRWRTVAGAFGVRLGTRESVTAYYRSQFLNATLPGGIVGDAHRAVRHGRDIGDVGAGVRATAWERGSGQVVQLGLVLVVLASLGSPLRPLAPLAAGGLLAVAGAGWCVLRRGGRLATDLRTVLGVATASRVSLASCGTSLGHLVVFAIAVRSVGVDASWSLVLAAGLVVMVGSAIPLSIAGWGPREGLTAWVFGMVGLGSAAGLTVSLVYGVLAAVATLPGALVLAGDAFARRTRATVEVREPAAAGELEGVRRG